MPSKSIKSICVVFSRVTPSSHPSRPPRTITSPLPPTNDLVTLLLVVSLAPPIIVSSRGSLNLEEREGFGEINLGDQALRLLTHSSTAHFLLKAYSLMALYSVAHSLLSVFLFLFHKVLKVQDQVPFGNHERLACWLRR